MNQELFLKLMSAILNLEATTPKRVHFYYYGFTNSISFSISPNSERFLKKIASFDTYHLNQESFDRAILIINDAASTPDESTEPLIRIEIEESKAKELGLIA